MKISRININPKIKDLTGHPIDWTNIILLKLLIFQRLHSPLKSRWAMTFHARLWGVRQCGITVGWPWRNSRVHYHPECMKVRSTGVERNIRIKRSHRWQNGPVLVLWIRHTVSTTLTYTCLCIICGTTWIKRNSQRYAIQDIQDCMNRQTWSCPQHISSNIEGVV